MLDLHAHVIPGIDDGPKTLEDALALLRALVDDGVEHVVATPHIYPGVYNNTPQRIAAACEPLVAALELHKLPITLSWAAEVRLCAEMDSWLRQGSLPLLGGEGAEPAAVLVELPDGSIPLGSDRLLAALVAAGVTPVLAHPERNKAVMEKPDRVRPLVELGCVLQLTAGSVLGEFGSKVRDTAVALLDAGLVRVVASDAHNLTSRRPRMTAAHEWLCRNYGDDLALALTRTQPARLAGLGEVVVQGAQGLYIRELPARQRNGMAAEGPGLRAEQLADWSPADPANPTELADTGNGAETGKAPSALRTGASGWGSLDLGELLQGDAPDRTGPATRSPAGTPEGEMAVATEEQPAVAPEWDLAALWTPPEPATARTPGVRQASTQAAAPRGGQPAPAATAAAASAAAPQPDPTAAPAPPAAPPAAAPTPLPELRPKPEPWNSEVPPSAAAPRSRLPGLAAVLGAARASARRWMAQAGAGVPKAEAGRLQPPREPSWAGVGESSAQATGLQTTEEPTTAPQTSSPQMPPPGDRPAAAANGARPGPVPAPGGTPGRTAGWDLPVLQEMLPADTQPGVPTQPVRLEPAPHWDACATARLQDAGEPAGWEDSASGAERAFAKTEPMTLADLVEPVAATPALADEVIELRPLPAEQPTPAGSETPRPASGSKVEREREVRSRLADWADRVLPDAAGVVDVKGVKGLGGPPRPRLNPLEHSPGARAPQCPVGESTATAATHATAPPALRRGAQMGKVHKPLPQEAALPAVRKTSAARGAGTVQPGASEGAGAGLALADLQDLSQKPGRRRHPSRG